MCWIFQQGMMGENMKEPRDLYDENKIKTGEIFYKGEDIPPGKYEMVVTLFVLDDKDKLLLQKRSKEKGGKYGFISGHPKAGETSLEGVITEAKEEMGIDVDSNEIKHFHTEKTKNKFYDFYILRKNFDTNNFKLQKEEVEAAKWFSIFETNDLIKKNEFFEKHIEAFDIIKKYLSKQ